MSCDREYSRHEMPRSKDSSGTRPARAAECDICREVFGSRASLNSHRWRHFCTVCRAVFVNTNDTTVHMRQSHKDDGVFADKCSVCFEVFPSNAALWQHFIDRHHRSNKSIEESELPPFLADMIAESSPTDDISKTAAAAAALMGPLLSAAAAANGKDGSALAAFLKADNATNAFPMFPFPTPIIPGAGASGIGDRDPDNNKSRSPVSKSPGISQLANVIKNQISSSNTPVGLPGSDGNLRVSPKAALPVADINGLQSHCFVVTPAGIPIGVLPMSASLLAGAAAGLGGFPFPFPAAFQQQFQQQLMNNNTSSAVKQEPVDSNDNQLMIDTEDDRQVKKQKLDSSCASQQIGVGHSSHSVNNEGGLSNGRQTTVANSNSNSLASSVNHRTDRPTRSSSNSSSVSLSPTSNHHANNSTELKAAAAAVESETALDLADVKQENSGQQNVAKHVRMRKRPTVCKLANGVPLASSLQEPNHHHQSASSSAGHVTGTNRCNNSSSSVDAVSTSLHQIINRLTNKASSSKDQSDCRAGDDVDVTTDTGMNSLLGGSDNDNDGEDDSRSGAEHQAGVYALATFDSVTLWNELKRRKFVFSCHCGQSFTEKMPFMMHRGGHVTREGHRRCPDCTFVTRTWTDYVMHILSHQQ